MNMLEVPTVVKEMWDERGTELIVASVVLGILTWWVHFWFRYVRHMDRFDGPPTNFFLGNALDLRVNTEVIHVFHRYTKQHGTMCKVRVGLQYMILITDCKFLEFLLFNPKVLTKGKVYTFLSRWLGTGLLTARAEKWRAHRRIINPAFYVTVLDQFVDVFNTQTDKLIQKLEHEVGKESFDIFPYITLCALDTICETAMGVSLDTQDNANADYVKSVQTMCTIILERASSPFLFFDWIYKLTSRYRDEKRALKVLHETTNSVIARKLKERSESPSITDPTGIETGQKRKLAFLDLLLEYIVSGRPLSPEALREEVDTFMFAGHDTTAAAMSFAVYSLAQYPAIQKRVLAEQKEIFYDDMDRPLTPGDLLKMKYLENVIKETLRLYPSVPFYVRHLDEDLAYGTKVIPKETSLMIFAYGLHRKEELFENAEEFKPDRFEDMSNKMTFSYLPFSAGPRNCIGQKFAMMEMKATISKIVRSYELLPANPEHKLQISGETVLRAVNGVKISLKKRTL